MQDVERHLDGDMLAGVVLADEQDFGFVLVGGDVVADLDRPQLAPLIGLTNTEEIDQVRIPRSYLLDVSHHLIVIVIGCICRWKIISPGNRLDRVAKLCDLACLPGCGTDNHVVGTDLNNVRSDLAHCRAIFPGKYIAHKVCTDIVALLTVRLVGISGCWSLSCCARWRQAGKNKREYQYHSQ